MFVTFIIIAIILFVISIIGLFIKSFNFNADLFQIPLVCSLFVGVWLGLALLITHTGANEKIREIESTQITLNSITANTLERAAIASHIIELNVWIREQHYENRSVWTGDLTIPDKVMEVQLLK